MLVTPFNLCDDGLNDKHSSVFGMALWNSEILTDLDSYFPTPVLISGRYSQAYQSHPTLFNDIPTQTTVLIALGDR